MSFHFYSYEELPVPDSAKAPLLAAWPQFMLHDPVAARCFSLLYDRFPAFQQFMFDDANGELVAEVNSVPVALNLADLPDRGWDEAIEAGTTGTARPTVVSGLGVMIRPDRQGQGLSALCLGRMREVASAHGFTDLVAPVRPSVKARYPLTPIERYITWTDPSGLPFDPWLRTHARVGGTIVQVCPQAMTIPGTVAEWEEWTGLVFPESGDYVIPGALNPISVDLHTDRVRYVEPNVWMHHQV